MINIKRPKEPPNNLVSKECLETIRELEEIYGTGGKPPEDAIKPHWRAKSVRNALDEMQHGKCAYCKRKGNEFRETDVDHFRPKGAVDGVEDHPGYWWLAHQWRNLLASCKPCNSDSKMSFFPLRETGCRAFKPGDSLDEEKPALIDPADEEPIDCIGWDPLPVLKEEARYLVYAYPRPEHTQHDRAAASIRYYGLNKGSLPKERGEIYVDIRSKIQMFLVWRHIEAGQKDKPNTDIARARVKAALHPSVTFLGLRRWVVESFRPELGAEFLAGE